MEHADLIEFRSRIDGPLAMHDNLRLIGAASPQGATVGVAQPSCGDRQHDGLGLEQRRGRARFLLTGTLSAFPPSVPLVLPGVLGAVWTQLRPSALRRGGRFATLAAATVFLLAS